MLRFIPYVGPAVAFVLPLIFSFAHFPGWAPPLEVVALFGAVEIALNSFLEPVIYGKTTGVSALGLLVAAMFWTWLWGTLGRLLSTPMTVCLVVLGKYVPSLRFFATLLGEETELEPDVQLYQRLVALERDKAIEVVETALRQRPRVEIFDQVLVPVLARAERDVARTKLDGRGGSSCGASSGRSSMGWKTCRISAWLPPSRHRQGLARMVGYQPPHLCRSWAWPYRIPPTRWCFGCWGNSMLHQTSAWRSSRTPNHHCRLPSVWPSSLPGSFSCRTSRGRGSR
jgi:AI-2E family transporter